MAEAVADKPEEQPLDPESQKLVEQLAGPMTAVSLTVRTIERDKRVFMELMRSAYNAARRRNDGQNVDAELKIVAGELHSQWYRLHESVLVGVSAIANIERLESEFSGILDDTLAQIELDFVNSAVMVASTCLLIGYPAPGVLLDVDLSSGEMLSGRFKTLATRFTTILNEAPVEQTDNVDLYVLARKVIKGEEVKLAECQIEDPPPEAAKPITQTPPPAAPSVGS